MLILVFDINAQTTYFHSWIIASMLVVRKCLLDFTPCGMITFINRNTIIRDRKVGQQIDIIFKQIGHSQQTPTIVFCVVE